MAEWCCWKGTGGARAAWGRLQSVSFILVSRLFLIGPGKNRLTLGRLSAIYTPTARAVLLQRDAAHGGARFFLDFRFAFRASAPEGIREAVFHGFFQLFVVLRVVRVAFAERQRLVVQRLLNFREQFLDGRRKVRERRADLSFLAGTVAPRENRGLFCDVFRAEFHAQRHPAHLPIVEFPARALPFALIESHANACFRKFSFQFPGCLENRFLFLIGLENRSEERRVGKECRSRWSPY